MRFDAVVQRWHRAVQGIEFVPLDYRETLRGCQAGDFAFIDPPYANNRGRYFPQPFDHQAFLSTLKGLNEKGVLWMLTFDGRAGDRLYGSEVPRDLYRHKISIFTGNSPFPRLMGNAIDRVEESVYLNYEPPWEAARQVLPQPRAP